MASDIALLVMIKTAALEKTVQIVFKEAKNKNLDVIKTLMVTFESIQDRTIETGSFLHSYF